MTPPGQMTPGSILLLFQYSASCFLSGILVGHAESNQFQELRVFPSPLREKVGIAGEGINWRHSETNLLYPWALWSLRPIEIACYSGMIIERMLLWIMI